jgi:hypothetical protein
MNEALKTGAFLAGAVALAIAAAVVQPERRAAAVFSDEGDAFYPQFRDPQSVKAIEVVDYDESTATARPLKVEFRKGRWVIASSNDYPIDIGDRLVKTSASLIDLKKDQVRSELVQDHAKYGVIDPLDQKVSSLQGRGKRVTLRDAAKNIVAEYILGKVVEGKAGWRYLRVPGQKRTYAVKTDADPSAGFADWVNADLLRVPSAQIRRVSILNYNASELMRGGNQMENVALLQEGGQWKSGSGEAIKVEAARTMAATLDRLKIVDARPKPPEMARDLRAGQMQLSLETAMSLRQSGFMLMQNGRVLASEGEMSVDLGNGVAYYLRFGDVAASADAAKGSRGDNRYLFVTAHWDAARAAKYGDTSGAGEKVARDLNARFADWFYVISGSDFQKLRLKKSDVLR